MRTKLSSSKPDNKETCKSVASAGPHAIFFCFIQFQKVAFGIPRNEQTTIMLSVLVYTKLSD